MVLVHPVVQSNGKIYWSYITIRHSLLSFNSSWWDPLEIPLTYDVTRSLKVGLCFIQSHQSSRAKSTTGQTWPKRFLSYAIFHFYSSISQNRSDPGIAMLFVIFRGQSHRNYAILRKGRMRYPRMYWDNALEMIWSLTIFG